MSDWVKKLNKAVGGDLVAGESIVAGAMTQPAGMMRATMAREIGGLAGAAIARRFKSDDASLVSDAGLAATIPTAPLVLGATTQRLLVCSWAKLTGKPKDLLTSIPLTSIEAVELDKGTASHRLVIMFADGTGKLFEAPRVGNPVEEFVSAFPR